MATINGAKAMGMADEIGSLEAGKRADVIVLNMWRPEWVEARLRKGLGRKRVAQLHRRRRSVFFRRADPAEESA